MTTKKTIDLNLPWSCADNDTIIIDADGEPAVCGLSADEAPFIIRAVNTHRYLVDIVRSLVAESNEDFVADMMSYGEAHACGRAIIARFDAETDNA